jgi:hypothetical protein
MTLQELRLKVSLNEAIQDWIDKNSTTDDWASTGVIIHDTTSEDMATIAFTLFRSLRVNQEYCLEQGFVNKP